MAAMLARAMADLERELWKIKVYLPAALGLGSRATLRAMRGAHTSLFKEKSITDFFSSEYRISPQSERMGYRLQGNTLELKSSVQLLSEATSFGSVQVPPDRSEEHTSELQSLMRISYAVF